MTAQPPPFNWEPPVPPQLPPPPHWHKQPVPAPQTSVLAVVSCFLGFFWIFWIGSLLAIVLGHVARRQVREMGYGGDAFAIIGLIFGYIGVATLMLFVILPAMINAVVPN